MSDSTDFDQAITSLDHDVFSWSVVVFSVIGAPLLFKFYLCRHVHPIKGRMPVLATFSNLSYLLYIILNCFSRMFQDNACAFMIFVNFVPLGLAMALYIIRCWTLLFTFRLTQEKVVLTKLVNENLSEDELDRRVFEESWFFRHSFLVSPTCLSGILALCLAIQLMFPILYSIVSPNPFSVVNSSHCAWPLTSTGVMVVDAVYAIVAITFSYAIGKVEDGFHIKEELSYQWKLVLVALLPWLIATQFSSFRQLEHSTFRMSELWVDVWLFMMFLAGVFYPLMLIRSSWRASFRELFRLHVATNNLVVGSQRASCRKDHSPASSYADRRNSYAALVEQHSSYIDAMLQSSAPSTPSPAPSTDSSQSAPDLQASTASHDPLHNKKQLVHHAPFLRPRIPGHHHVPRLIKVITTSDGFAAFQHFLCLEFAAENLMCWQEIQRFKALFTKFTNPVASPRSSPSVSASVSESSCPSSTSSASVHPSSPVSPLVSSPTIKLPFILSPHGSSHQLAIPGMIVEQTKNQSEKKYIISSSCSSSALSSQCCSRAQASDSACASASSSSSPSPSLSSSSSLRRSSESSSAAVLWQSASTIWNHFLRANSEAQVNLPAALVRPVADALHLSDLTSHFVITDFLLQQAAHGAVSVSVSAASGSASSSSSAVSISVGGSNSSSSSAKTALPDSASLASCAAADASSSLSSSCNLPLSMNSFENAERGLERLMESDSYTRFVRTEEFQDILHAHPYLLFCAQCVPTEFASYFPSALRAPLAAPPSS